MEPFQAKFINEQKLPLLIEPTQELTFEKFLNLLKEKKHFFESKMLNFGGLLFRGFPVSGAEAFNQVVEALDLGKPVNYVGGDTPRDKVRNQVYTSTEAPPNFMIPLHNEMSFINNYPKHIYFYCDHPPAKGGETTIADARRIYERIGVDVKERFVKRELKYVSNFYGRSWLLNLINKYQRAHKTWMDAFETDDREEVSKRCESNEFGYKWNKGDWLQVIYNRPSVIAHPKTGERVWFNQAHLYDYNPRLLGKFNWLGTKLLYMKKDTILHEIYHKDDKKVARNDIYHVMDVLEDETIKFPWQKGDVLVLDNVLAMHGRAPFSGKRRILASLTR